MIRKAIREKRCLGFMYNGLYRIVEPHGYGQVDNVDRVHSIQVRGQSSQKCLGWRTMCLEKMSYVEILDHTFRYRMEDPRRDIEWDEIYLLAAMDRPALKNRLPAFIQRLLGRSAAR